MWRELILGLTSEVTFATPITDPALTQAAASIDGDLPGPLASLLQETNGIKDRYGSDLVWPLERVVADNRDFRSNPDFTDLYMPFDPLLFFADAGNGDQFAFLWTPRRDEVFVWDHESDERKWVAKSLEDYLERRAGSDGDDWYK